MRFRRESNHQRLRALLVVSGMISFVAVYYSAILFGLPRTTMNYRPIDNDWTENMAAQWEKSSSPTTSTATTKTTTTATETTVITITQRIKEEKVITEGAPPPPPPWKTSSRVPTWMKEYFEWHQDARANIIKTGNWTQYNYLVVRCLRIDKRCGGGADRLRPLPFMILLASMTERLLFYKWERPCDLEEFLLPPPGGLDWRWPPHPNLTMTITTATNTTKHDDSDVLKNARLLRNNVQPLYQNGSAIALEQVVSIIYQLQGHGSSQFNAVRSNPATDAKFDEVFRDIWYSVFVPAKPVQDKIDLRMRQLGLTPNHYHAIHIRSMYIKSITNETMEDIASNSLNCLQQIVMNNADAPLGLASNDTIIYVASDQWTAQRAVALSAQQRGIPRVVMATSPINTSTTTSRDGVVLLENTSLHHQETQEENNRMHLPVAQEKISTHHQVEDEQEPTLHLDRGTEFLNHRNPALWNQYKPHQYYGTFVDLYIMSQSKCIVTGSGNFGKWANLLSQNVSCHLDTSIGHRDKPFAQRCSWTTTATLAPTFGTAM